MVSESVRAGVSTGRHDCMGDTRADRDTVRNEAIATRDGSLMVAATGVSRSPSGEGLGAV
jgi:hypothetical protein